VRKCKHRVGYTFPLCQRRVIPKAYEAVVTRNHRKLVATVQSSRWDENVSSRVADNPHLWWASSQNKFPHLAQLAQRFLTIPATSAPLEILFSSAGLIIANDRARLDGDLAVSTIFLRDVVNLIIN
jgi:hypothetical protein